VDTELPVLFATFYVNRQVQPCIAGHPTVRSWVDPLVRISKQMY